MSPLPILDALPVAVTTIDMDGVVLFMNALAASHLRTSRDEAIGRSIFEFFPDPDRQRAGRERLQQVGRRRVAQRFESLLTLPSGETKIFESTYVPVIAGEAVVAVHIVSWEGETLRAADDSDSLWRVVPDTLSMTPERVGALLEGVPVSVSVIDLDGTVRYVNWVVEGLDIDEVIGSSWKAWLVESSHRVLDEAYARVLETQELTECELEGRSGRRWLVRLVPLRHRGQVQQFLGCALDITEQRRLESELLHRQKVESLGTMASGIAHDFNNLLTVITSNTCLAMKWLASDRDPTSLLQNAETAARQAAELCAQMLTYAGRDRPTLESIDFNAVIEDMAPLTRAAVHVTVEPRYDLAADLPKISGNRGQLGQIVLNLVNNAADSMTAGTEGASIVVSTERVALTGAALAGCLPKSPRAGDYVRLRVTDNGAGISESDLDRIFDPFYSTKELGHGLGLSAVLGAVTSHGAAIQVVSRSGEGTVVNVYFPIPAAGAGESLSDEPAAAASRGSGTVLVVDDEAAIRHVATLILRDSGYDVVLAADGEEALEQIARCGDELSAVLLDVNMPRRDGISTLTALRETHPTLPVVLVSGNLPQVPEPLQDDRCVRLLQKPYEPKRLLSALVDAMRGDTSTS